jgi:hypothetical protein
MGKYLAAIRKRSSNGKGTLNKKITKMFASIYHPSKK